MYGGVEKGGEEEKRMQQRRWSLPPPPPHRETGRDLPRAGYATDHRRPPRAL